MSKAGQSIIMIGNAASHRALSILKERRAELIVRYPERYLKRGQELLEEDLSRCSDFLKYMVKGEENETCFMTGDSKTYIGMECDKSGVFGGLWKLGEQAKCGLCVEQGDIPVLQIAIELCDYVDESLFETDSEGTSLIIAKNGKLVLERLKKMGIGACEIGYTTDNNDKVVKNNENTRFINKVR